MQRSGRIASIDPGRRPVETMPTGAGGARAGAGGDVVAARLWGGCGAVGAGAVRHRRRLGRDEEVELRSARIGAPRTVRQNRNAPPAPSTMAASSHGRNEMLRSGPNAGGALTGSGAGGARR